MKISAKNTVVKLDDINGSPQNISFDSESFSVNTAVDQPEVTGFGDGVHNFVPGMPIFDVTLNCFWNTSSTSGAMSVLRQILGSTTSKTLSIAPETGGTSLNGEFMLVSFTPSGTTKDAVKLGAAKFVPMGSTAPTWA